MKSPEQLLTRVINHLAENFKEKIVLKGGMLLRLYNSPRFTQDVDFVLLTEESKKVWRDKIVKALQRMDGVKVGKVELNSRGIFIDIEDLVGEQKALVEVNIQSSTHLPSEPISTALLGQKYSLSPRVISSMAPAEAFSHKIAATLERNAVRDLYDLCQMEAMGNFDAETLKERLAKLSIHREKPRAVPPLEASEILRKKLETLNQKKIEDELLVYLPEEYRPGVLPLIRASLGRIIQKIAAL